MPVGEPGTIGHFSQRIDAQGGAWISRFLSAGLIQVVKQIIDLEFLDVADAPGLRRRPCGIVRVKLAGMPRADSYL
jgi:hypothetical protein